MSKLNLGRDLFLKGRIGWQGLSKDEYLEKSDYKIINATALMDGYVDWDNCGYITKERYEEAKEIMLQENDILISKDGTLGKIGYVKNLSIPCSVASGIFVLRNTKPKDVNFDYIYHILKSFIFKDFIRRNRAQGSTIPHLYQRDLENFEIDLPDYNLQSKIANVLNSLDSKIMINSRTITELELMAKTLYDYWFLQFEFPNEEGKPYKSSGGKMAYNEELKREIPEGWILKHAVDIAEIKTGKEDANHSTGNGQYPFFTCSNDILKCDDYKFDSNSILIAGNGDFNVKHYKGKFNAYQRTYVITPFNEKYIGLFELCCKQTIERFKKGSNGSIVKFITLGDIQNIQMLDSGHDDLLKPFNVFLEKIDIIKKENQELASLRDFLLPMLMNGQVTFK